MSSLNEVWFWGRLVVIAAVGMTLAGGNASFAVADTTLAELARTTPVSTYKGRTVWSTYDEATGKFALTTSASGLTSAVPIDTRKIPFDADLGPDSDGHTVAVYSRCETEPKHTDDGVTLWTGAKGCELYEYDFETGSEKALTSANSPSGSEFLPSIWKDRIAFGRTYDDRDSSVAAVLYVRSISSSDSSKRMPGGDGRDCWRDYKGNLKCTIYEDIAFTGMDLYGKRLGFARQFQGTSEGYTYELLLDTLGDDSSRLLDDGTTGMSSDIYRAPSISSGSVYYLETCTGDESGCTGRLRFHRYKISSGGRYEAKAPSGLVSQSRAGSDTFYVKAPDLGNTTGYSCQSEDVAATQSCTLAEASDLEFTAD